MKKLIIILFLYSFSAPALVSQGNLSEFTGLCHKRTRGTVNNHRQYCECLKENFKWLISDRDWNYTKKIYTEEMSDKDILAVDGLSELNMVIIDTEVECLKSAAYLAPKAERLKKKSGSR